MADATDTSGRRDGSPGGDNNNSGDNDNSIGKDEVQKSPDPIEVVHPNLGYRDMVNLDLVISESEKTTEVSSFLLRHPLPVCRSVFTHTLIDSFPGKGKEL